MTDPITLVFWGLTIGGALIGAGIAVAVIVWTGRDYTRALSMLQDANASRAALSRSLREVETENVWLRAQLDGAGLTVGLPPAGDRTRRLVRSTTDGIVVVQDGAR